VELEEKIIMLNNTINHKFVPKGWGYELWITNTEKYCGKILHIVKDKKSSWHYHKLKDEVMYVQYGCIVIVYGRDEDINNADERVLMAGDSFHIPVGLIHRIIALETSQVFEFSTQHFDDDSIRIEKGD
jgi:mannose-6-phosphate isomerase-like protein (cupin superfamily)